MQVIKPDSLVLYKTRPARVLRMGDRIEIEIENGEILRVRAKDILALHPGPLHNLSELVPQQGDIRLAWELLSGENTNLIELAELTFGDFTPATAWSIWQEVADQLFFTGEPENIRARTVEEVERKQLERDQVEAERQAWMSFIHRIRRGVFEPQDKRYLMEIENMARGISLHNSTLRELGRAETAVNAHALLLDLGYWDWQINPHPLRQGVVLEQVGLPVPDLPQERRSDLTNLLALAIDDEETDTPDDAISLDGNRIWVHIADVGSLIEPDSALDEEALSRGTSLHLPEGTVHLLPRDVTRQLGMGMQQKTPALSFGIDLGQDGAVQGFEIVPSWVRVERRSYQEAETLVEKEPLRTLKQLTDTVRDRRRGNQALMIDFPEVNINVKEGRVSVQPVLPHLSRMIVEEVMILTGVETARFAISHGICIPFSQQDPVDTNQRPETLSGMVALRRQLKRSNISTEPGPHSGLGVPLYTQVTSPLRRYLDLVVHQQLRAFLRGKPGLTADQVAERINSVDSLIRSLRRAEVDSERHWTMVYLLQNPGWQGEGILVEKHGSTGMFILPDLALEPRISLRRDWALDQRLPVALTGVNLPQLEASFRVIE